MRGVGVPLMIGGIVGLFLTAAHPAKDSWVGYAISSVFVGGGFAIAINPNTNHTTNHYGMPTNSNPLPGESRVGGISGNTMGFHIHF